MKIYYQLFLWESTEWFPQKTVTCLNNNTAEIVYFFSLKVT